MFDGLASPFHWLVILVVLLIVLGPNEAVKAARAVARTLEQLRRLGREPIDELLAHVADTQPDNDQPTRPSMEGHDDHSAREHRRA